jgi:malate synthase
MDQQKNNSFTPHPLNKEYTMASFSLEVNGNITPQYREILTPAALDFVSKLEREFGLSRLNLLNKRIMRQHEIDNGVMPSFLTSTKNIREDRSWKVATIPSDLQNRRVEITGPVDRKMMINALNSGANVFMADFEDATSPTWQNLIEGHINLRDTIDRTISFSTPEGKQYTLKQEIATLMVRPRGWHLHEKHVLLNGQPISASLFDAGLYFFHNAQNLLKRETGPYFYIPKLENHLEARLWNDVFTMMQDELGLPRGTIKVTVLLETILAAFEMEEILYELRDHIVGLNAGRWDYIFSIIKKFHHLPNFLLPDRAQITMTVPFMRAYTELLVKTCHQRGAHAIGGMAAFIPSRKDPKINRIALAKVREDKERECADGFDGTWVAHPDLVPVAKAPFDAALAEKPHQKEKLKESTNISASQLFDFNIEGGAITEQGVRNNVSVAMMYLESWLQGIGAAGINNLMEDAATAEISRSQLWQWVHHPKAVIEDGTNVDMNLITQMLGQELEKIHQSVGNDKFKKGKFTIAAELLSSIVGREEFEEFVTIRAYELLD